MNIKRCLYLSLAFIPMAGWAEEIGVTELLTRIRQNGPAQFRYEETRTLELASSPWHGQGYMLSGADGSLVKLQLQPKRVIMAIADLRMYYWDPEQNQRHSAALGSAGPAGEQITVFRSILQGRTEELQAGYDFVPEKHGKSWALRMTPKSGSSDEDAPTVEISGDEDDKQRRILIRQADGESTEYRMVKASGAQEQQYSIPRLLSEAIGE